MTVDDVNEHSYNYDVLYQLTEAVYPNSNTSYYYDVMGNRTSMDNGDVTIYTHNKLNQYDSVYGLPWSYDKNGNVIEDAWSQYYYDCENRLTDVNYAGDKLGTYTYDYLGRRVSKIAGGQTTKFCYDGERIIAEYNGSGTLVRKYVYGPGIDEPVCMTLWGLLLCLGASLFILPALEFYFFRVRIDLTCVSLHGTPDLVEIPSSFRSLAIVPNPRRFSPCGLR